MKTIQSIDKAIFVLEHVSKHNGKLSLTDLSHLLGMKITTLHGIISTLEYGKLLYKNPSSGKYSLGLKLFEWGKQFEADFSITEIAHPYMEELAEQYNETIHLAVPYENKILYIDKVESVHKFRFTSMVGTTEEAFRSAIGLVILANLSAPHLPEFLGGIDEYHEKQHFETPLPALLSSIKQEGYYTQFESPDDYYCIAAPIVKADATVAGALSIVLPSHRYQEDLCHQIVEQLKRVVSEISSNI
ncbi:IclR family transcriptional regulator [Paenibacillus sp. sgz500992]|uniref:IclR family transcriptional regulator n=1 Tax=Paenibacillus sp. sgz500992 TaxID=3242476 RepID=UPI0036D3E9A7